MMKRIYFLFLLLWTFTSAKGDTLFVSDLGRQTKLSELKKIEIAIVGKGKLLKDPRSLVFAPYRTPHNVKPKHSYCIKLTLCNNLSYANTIFFNNTPSDEGIIYQDTNGRLTEIGKAGMLVPNRELSLKHYTHLIPVYIKPNQTSTIYYLGYENHLDEPVINFTLHKQPNLLLERYHKEVEPLIYTLFFLGAFSFLSLFILFMYYKSKQRIYLFYALYLIGAIIYSLTRLSPITILGAWIDNFPYWKMLFNEPAQLLFFAFYNFFVIELLDIKKQDPKLAKILKYLAIIYVIYSFYYYTINYIYFDQANRSFYFKIHRLILFPINILLIIRCIFSIKSPVLKYFLTGISCFMLASFISMYSVVILRDIGLESIKATNIFQIGLMTEALCFAFALGHKIRLNEQEKTEVQNALILQLETNQQITEKANQELEEKVKQRTAQLVEANKQIDEKKAKEIKAFFDQKLAQAETMALRSQMNPHFLFNSLNSIKYLIQSQQNKLAIVYLSKFSKLVRMVLEHSKTELVSLAAEIEALKLYLEIESNRLGEQFTYQMNISKGISLDNIQIPPMLLQPFVENAIWHGLLNSDKPTKEVTITITKNSKKKVVICDIADNGIGREKSAILKKNITKHHQSFGTSLIFDRVKLYNQQYPNEIEVKIEDILKNNEVEGTKVLINIYEKKNN